MGMLCRKRFILVSIVWIWLFVGALVTVLLMAFIKGVSLDMEHVISMLNKEPYLASYVEVIAAGALPLFFTLYCRDNIQIYGVKREGVVRSLVLSILMVTPFIFSWVLYGGMGFYSFNLRFPYNIWYAFLGVIAYGPLEVFFVVWLIVNTDLVFKKGDNILSPGLLITVIVFSLSHIILSPQAGLSNAISVLMIWMLLGLVFKYTGNSVGPMVAWTLINGQVTRLVIGCLT